MLPDIELVLTTWARTTFGVTSCTALPPNLADVLPVVQVTVVGGAGGRFSSSPRVDVDVYAASYKAAKELAIGVHKALVRLHGTVGDAVIREVLVSSIPTQRPYDNSGLQRVGGSYVVNSRPVAS